MERREAIQVFREIKNNVPDAFLIGNIVLTRKSNVASDLEGYSLHIKMALAQTTINNIRLIAARHHLIVDEESSGYLVIYKRTRGVMNITA